MSYLDDRASLQIKSAAAAQGLRQTQLTPQTGISRSAMSRIFRGDRSQISVGEYVSLHLALGNDPAGQLTKLIAASYPAPANMQQYFAVEYSAVTGLPILHNGQLASTELGQHSTDQDAINHARTLLPVAANIGPLLQGSDSKRWTIFTAAELNNLIAEIE